MSQDDTGSGNGRRRPSPPPRDPKQRARYEAEEAYRKKQQQFEQEEGPADELRQMGLKLLRRAFAEQAHVRHAVSDYGAEMQRKFLLRALDGDEERYRMVVERMERSSALSKEHMRKAAALRMDYLSSLLDVQRGWVDGFIDRWRNRTESDSRSARFVERLVGLGDEDIQHATIKSVVLVEIVKDMLKGQDPYFEKLTEEERQQLLEFTLGMRDTPPDLMATLFKDVDVRRPRGVPKRQPQGNQAVEARFDDDDTVERWRAADAGREKAVRAVAVASAKRVRADAVAASAVAAGIEADVAAARAAADKAAAELATAKREENAAVEATRLLEASLAEDHSLPSDSLLALAKRPGLPWFVVGAAGGLRASVPDAMTDKDGDRDSYLSGSFSFEDDHLEDREFTYFIGPCISEPPPDWDDDEGSEQGPWPDSRFSADVVKVQENHDDPLVHQEETDDSPPRLRALEAVTRSVRIMFRHEWFHAHALSLRDEPRNPAVSRWFKKRGWMPSWAGEAAESRSVVLPYRVQITLPELRRSVLVRFLVIWTEPPGPLPNISKMAAPAAPP